MGKRIYSSFLAFSFIALWVGCYNPFSPSVIGPGAIKPIAPQVDPDSVLHNFKYAYENRDSIVYENCLDKNFTFTYKDQDETEREIQVEIPRDGRGGDLYVTRALFRTFDDIRLDTWIVTPAPEEEKRHLSSLPAGYGRRLRFPAPGGHRICRIHVQTVPGGRSMEDRSLD